ncbi:uncharacterized protein LY79DRAFT_691382 [Colletotrichum navitas]|uniref:Uncharacterized protein n=1 Tax=Colletotrichum navitas TaxID=681940 RepID=A0AAD8QCG3_9PEZI|nr:uncharacterized protein LY79DRAFT_691382 [Colletotrichum navitas]KAK1598394.1 hypothetical protein LY79DRAFT_691382 [Colletotrichum navitas]
MPGGMTTSAGNHENTEETGTPSGVIHLTGSSPPQAQQPPSSVDTRERSQHEKTTAVSTGPPIALTLPSEHTIPLSQTQQETNLPTSTLAPPPIDGRIYTPPREQIPLSPLTPDLPGGASEEEDVDMVDVGPEDADAEADDEDKVIEETYGDGWIINWLKRDRATTDEDLHMMDYQGWRIHSPKVQLIRIKNFLADEDIDRTLDWKRKFAEIGEFLQHCLGLKGARGRDWWVDLQECINMLHTHWVFEKYHYGERKLVVDFPKYLGISTRLPPLPDGRAIIAAKRPEDPVRPRYLLHRVPESVQDVDYQIPGPLLRTMFMTWFRQDGNLVWAADPNGPRPGSGQRGAVFQYQPDFNMALTEDEWFAKCMDGGPEATSGALRGEANFYLLHNEYVAGEVGEVGGRRGRPHATQKFYPEGEAQQRFARYRGAKRAALQQCLSHFDGVENVAIQSPFRKLVLPLTRRQRKRAEAEASVNIVYKPLAVKAPPEDAKLDPLGLVYWHAKLRENHAARAAGLREKVVASHRRLAEENDTVLLPHNFLGPVTPFHLLRESEQRLVARHALLATLRDRLRRAWARNPRQMLEGVIKNMELGLEGRPSWNLEDELVAHREKHDGYLEMNDRELYWVDFVCGPSTNVKMQREALPRLGRAFEVFAARVQALLDEPSQECLFAVQKRGVSLQQVTLALNASLRHGDYVFSEDMVNMYSRVLADHGRLGYERTETGEVNISRPECTWHPEHRMNWPVDDDDWDPITNPWTAANVPTPEHTWDWETAFVNVDKVDATRRATKRMLWSAAYRAGVELSALAQRLADLDRRLSRPASWDCGAGQLQAMAGEWQSEFERPKERSARPVSYASVVRQGYPGRWKKGMAEERAVEIVRRGMIDELSAGNSTLWPSRPRFSQADGKDVMTLHRDHVWAWARPEAAGPKEEKKKKRFFSVNRWPVHLQSEKTQAAIRMSLANEEADRDREEEEARAETARAASRARPTLEELQKAEVARSLSVPYHEVNDAQTEFFPGHGEYWEGDTPLQKGVIKAHVQRVIQEELGHNDGKAPRGTSWLGGGRPKASSSSGRDGGGEVFGLPDVEPEVVPRSVPAGSAVSATGQVAAEKGALLDRLPRPTTTPRPRLTERRRPLLSPRYPPGQEGQRRVRFQDEEGEK